MSQIAKSIRRRPMSLARYTRWMAVSNLIFWAVFLTFSAAGGFRMLQSDGRVPARAAVWLGTWAGFFVGFVAALTASLRARRALLVGFLQPTEQEWHRLEAPNARRRDGVWDTVLTAAGGLACICGGTGLLAQASLGQTLGRLPFALVTMLIPALGTLLIAGLSARRSVQRFVTAMEFDRPRVMKRSNYLVLHNVLPYALFSTATGVAVAVSRFLPAALEQRPIGAADLSTHLALTALIISLLVVAAARLKTRIDFLGPLVLTPGGPLPAKASASWRVWYALAAPVVVYVALRLGLMVAGLEAVPVAAAIGLKVVVCLLLAVGTAWWAVRSVLAQMESEALDEHRFVRVYRFLARIGFTSSKPSGS